MNSEITLTTTSYQKFESVKKYLFCGHFIVIFCVRKRIPHYNLEDLPKVLTWISKGVLLIKRQLIIYQIYWSTEVQSEYLTTTVPINDKYCLR